MPRPSSATPYLFTHGLQCPLAETCPDAPDAPRMPHGCPASNGPDALHWHQYSNCEKIGCASTHGKSACENTGYPHTRAHCRPPARPPTRPPTRLPAHQPARPPARRDRPSERVSERAANGPTNRPPDRPTCATTSRPIDPHDLDELCHK